MALAGLGALLLIPPAPAQDAPSQAAPANPPEATAPADPSTVTAPLPPAAAPNPAFRPGFVEVFGGWLKEGASRFKSGVEGAQEKIESFGSKAREAAKDATGAIPALPSTRPVSGHERCATAPNGSPDCQAAAAALCRGKGFQGGRLLDTQSEQKCPARVLLEGRAPNATECPTDTFVTRAICQ
jgi:hypothetical protein